jgi:hypothetical protein
MSRLPASSTAPPSAASAPVLGGAALGGKVRKWGTVQVGFRPTGASFVHLTRTMSTADRAAVAIQRIWRGGAGRMAVMMDYAEREWAAKEIQRVLRGYYTRLVLAQVKSRSSPLYILYG